MTRIISSITKGFQCNTISQFDARMCNAVGIVAVSMHVVLCALWLWLRIFSCCQESRLFVMNEALFVDCVDKVQSNKLSM